MRGPVILDTGPLVAYLHSRELHHGWAKEQWNHLAPPLLTCEAALAEAGFIHKRLGGKTEEIVEFVVTGAVQVPFRLEEEAAAVIGLLKRYRNVPMSLADACLVRMAEQHSDNVVFTLDSDFRIYRMHGRQVIPTIMPSQ